MIYNNLVTNYAKITKLWQKKTYLPQLIISISKLPFPKKRSPYPYPSLCMYERQFLPQISQITQINPKATISVQTVFLCEIMQPAAFLCIICGKRVVHAVCCLSAWICEICERIITQEYSINCTKKLQCLSQISLIIADKTQNNTNDKSTLWRRLVGDKAYWTSEDNIDYY